MSHPTFVWVEQLGRALRRWRSSPRRGGPFLCWRSNSPQPCTGPTGKSKGPEISRLVVGKQLGQHVLHADSVVVIPSVGSDRLAKACRLFACVSHMLWRCSARP